MAVKKSQRCGALITGVYAAMIYAAPSLAAPAAPPAIPQGVRGKDGVKTYLLAVLDGCVAATHDLKTSAVAYQSLVAAYASPAAAAQAEPSRMAELVSKMRDAYQRIDSYGYEYVEGIVAGVPGLTKYDVELDSGIPKALAQSPQDPIAPVVVQCGNDTLDHEGSLNNFLIEATVFGTNPKFTEGHADLPGFDKPVNLPKPAIVAGLADYAVDGYARLQKDSRAWQPTDKDCFQAVYNMTPTLADYFDEWKESMKGQSDGRFVAVARVSDMRGIMSSVRLTWEALDADVRSKDPALADSVSGGYAQVIAFIDKIQTREQNHALNVETVDALGSQAKERADKITVQTAQAAALMGVELNSK